MFYKTSQSEQSKSHKYSGQIILFSSEGKDSTIYTYKYHLQACWTVEYKTFNQSISGSFNYPRFPEAINLQPQSHTTADAIIGTNFHASFSSISSPSLQRLHFWSPTYICVYSVNSPRVEMTVTQASVRRRHSNWAFSPGCSGEKQEHGGKKVREDTRGKKTLLVVNVKDIISFKIHII